MSDRRSAVVSTKCDSCGNVIEIDQYWTAGGVNDYGGYVLQCKKCQHIFHLHLGRDIADSQVRKGAIVLDTYNDEVGNMQEILQKHGLA